MRVWVDAGHGGYDPGAVGPSGLREKDITLAVTKRIASLLEGKGYAVGVTRNKDEYVSLGEVCRRANTFGADIFVSVHCNAAEVPTAHGVETFHHPTSRKGIQLARLIQAELVAATGRRDRCKPDGAKYANFYVLKHTAMPAVLTEIGFISNPEEEELLASEDYQRKCAEAIVRGIDAYFGRE
jgi:N-acetylmuramoyl-L-alanine amidase